LQNTYAVVPQTGEAQLRIFNGFNCGGIINVSDIATDNKIEPLDFWKAPTLQVDGEESFPLYFHSDSCGYDIVKNVTVMEKQVICNKYMLRT